MSDDSDIGRVAKAYKEVYKSSVDFVCDAVAAYAKSEGLSQDSADVLLLELAKYIKMRPDGRAAQYLDHFVFGDGSTKSFDCATLILQDAGVRERVRSEIRKRLRAHPELATRTMSGGLFTVWIRQSDFQQADWLLALGSFPIEWQAIGPGSSRGGGGLCSAHLGQEWLDTGTLARAKHQSPMDRISSVATPTRARLSGSNEYKWHPAAPRVTQCLHQAADRLAKSRVQSMNFWMVARPCTMDLHTGLPAR